MPATLQRVPSISRLRKPVGHAPSFRTLIDELLAEQKSLLTPVACFAEIDQHSPDLAPHYRSLIPLSKPRDGEQYAFEVSLDRCTGCKACVSACHSLNGLDDQETWRDTGVMLGGIDAHGWQQTITTACHHCEDPSCMNGCPVAAYEKDAETGIVRHLDDQCIGCSYCILKCPYDVPKYSKKRGIVRKCDMCHQRLADGEAPACVQACPTEAIRIVAVNKDRKAAIKQGANNLFQSDIHNPHSSIPSSETTYPTTRYVGREIPGSAFAADRETLVPQHAHWPLVFMLVFTQAGIGLMLGSALVSFESYPMLMIAALLFYAGMAASVFHLGQPLKAWRFFLGLKTSWLSREILAFSTIMPIPAFLCIFPFLPDFAFKKLFEMLLMYSIFPLGLLAVFTSVMIYQDTKRAFWNFPRCAARFFGTAASFCALGILITEPHSYFACIVFYLILILKIVPEMMFLLNAKSECWTPDSHSARLLLEPLQLVLCLRMILLIVAMMIVLVEPWLALPFLLFADIFERQLFFQAVHAPKMPGNFGPSVN